MRQVLLNPGPVNVTDTVKAAIAGPDWCHREPEAFDLVDDVRARLLGAFDLDRAAWTAVLVGGSGTAAVEAMVASCAPAGRKLLVVRNGVYGDRIAAMARVYGIATAEIEVGWFDRPDLAAIEAAIAADPAIGALAIVHHETTTGLVNDVGAVGRLARARGVRVLVDTVSGLGGEALDLEAVDVAACTANKCVQGLPGVCFVLCRRDVLAAPQPPRSVYFDLANYARKQDARDTPFTPPLQALMALRQALIELQAETVAGRCRRYAARAAEFRAGFEAMGLTLSLPAAWRSNTITTVQMPAGMTYERLHDALKAAGFVIYAGQGDLRKTVFRVANMGEISALDVQRCLAVFRATFA